MRGAWIFVALAAAACGSEDTQFSTHVASDFPRATPLSVSVFGVFRDGRLSTKSWDEMSPRLASIGLEPCSALYDVDLVAGNGALASALDEFTRRNGVTDNLLGAVGAAARTDLIVVFVVSGDLQKHAVSEPPPPPPTARSRGYPTRFAPRREPSGLEITASLFSTHTKDTVASVALRYVGRSENDAIAQLDSKLRDLLPGVTCQPWDLPAHPLDPDAVRSLPED